MNTYNQAHRYKNEVEDIINNALANYIVSGEANSIEFRQWLSSKKIYYRNRFANMIIAKRPKTKMEIIELLMEEVDKLIEVFNQEKLNYEERTN